MTEHPTKEDRHAALVLRLFTLTVIVAIVVLIGVLVRMVVEASATRRIEQLEEKVRVLEKRVTPEKP